MNIRHIRNPRNHTTNGTRLSRVGPWLLGALVVAGLVNATGCDSGAGAAGPGGAGMGPLYAMMTQVYGVNDRSVYVSLTNTLDPGEISLADAREFPGVANFAAVGGRLLISNGQDPSITEFHIASNLGWQPDKTVSFEAYPLEDNANFYSQYILNDHVAYLPFETSKRVIWDPTNMTIYPGSMDDSNLVLEKDGLQLAAGGNRNGIRYAGPVLQPFFYHDENWLHHGTESFVAVYDPTTHKETKIITLPCAGSSVATQDEAGYTYLGTWDYPGTLALYGDGPAPCVARVKPDLTLDEGWTTDFTGQTGGRYVNNFRYIGEGKAIGNVLHHEELGVDFTLPFDEAVEARVWDSGPHWRFWIFDLNAARAWPIEGVDVAIGSGAQFAVLDGRTFVFLPFDDWSRTAVYELDDAGAATKRFEVAGDVFKWIRVR